MELIDGHAEKAMHLRGMQRHGEDATGPSSDQEICDQPPTDGNTRRVLLVGTGIGKVRDDSGDARG
jgi:hypothetical protein